MYYTNRIVSTIVSIYLQAQHKNMNIIHNKYNIIRYGDFATNGNTKIFYSIFAGTLCLNDYLERNSTDYLLIAIGASVLWSIVEIYLHTSGTRVIKPMFIGIRTNPKMHFVLPTVVGAILQGVQEGGCVTTIGLYYGDRIHDVTILARMHVFIAIVIANVWLRETNVGTNVVTSKRQVNAPVSMIFIGVITAVDVMMLWKHPEHIYRQLAMMSVMVYICSWWTVVTWYRGFRSVEVHVKRDTRDNEHQEYIIKPATTTELFTVLGYDVLFEIGIVYLVFYNIFLI